MLIELCLQSDIAPNSRLQVRSGQKKAAAIVARTQLGAKAGSTPVPVSKYPCYIVQRTNPGSASRSRFQITVDGSDGAKVWDPMSLPICRPAARPYPRVHAPSDIESV